MDCRDCLDRSVWFMRENKEKEVLVRIERLEEKVSELSEITKEVKETLNQFVCNDKMSPSLSRDVIGVTYHDDANPWALEATRHILETSKMREWITSARSETYKATINVLKASTNWLSAEEVGEKTGRKRNTESTYLTRLHRAGLINQKTDGNKALYAIKDNKTISRYFGDR